jgi:hypothetical protein
MLNGPGVAIFAGGTADLVAGTKVGIAIRAAGFATMGAIGAGFGLIGTDGSLGMNPPSVRVLDSYIQNGESVYFPKNSRKTSGKFCPTGA